MIWSWFAGVAAASVYTPWVDDFAVEAPAVVPIDAAPLLHANYWAQASATVEGAKPIDVRHRWVSSGGYGSRALIALDPPTRGWVPGAVHTVDVFQAQWSPDPGPLVASLSFTVGHEPAPPPSTPVVRIVGVGEWSAPDLYPHGCCSRMRVLDLEVEVETDDPWSWIRVDGTYLRQYPDDFPTVTMHAAIGPGVHLIRVYQWEASTIFMGPTVATPHELHVMHVSSSGATTTPIILPLPLDPPGAEDDDDEPSVDTGQAAGPDEPPERRGRGEPDRRGCSTTGGGHGGLPWLILGVLALVRRRRSDGASG